MRTCTSGDDSTAEAEKYNRAVRIMWQSRVRQKPNGDSEERIASVFRADEWTEPAELAAFLLVVASFLHFKPCRWRRYVKRSKAIPVTGRGGL
jgi:hypothetical protein